MKKILTTVLFLFCSTLILPVNASAEFLTGPTQSPLEVTLTYSRADGAAIYIQFSNGSMPGCYADKGGYLVFSEPYFEMLYAQILTLMAGRSMTGNVLYETTGSTSGWGMCHIKGLQLYPGQ